MPDACAWAGVMSMLPGAFPAIQQNVPSASASQLTVTLPTMVTSSGLVSSVLTVCRLTFSLPAAATTTTLWLMAYAMARLSAI